MKLDLMNSGADLKSHPENKFFLLLVFLAVEFPVIDAGMEARTSIGHGECRGDETG